MRRPAVIGASPTVSLRHGPLLRTIGVISDTHGLLRPEALEALRGSDLILHAGDVGSAEILERLAHIAPVRAVRGNTDHGDLARRLPAADLVDLARPGGDPSTEGGGTLAYLVHQLEHLDIDAAAIGVRVVVYGHTHEPHAHVRDGVLYFNPGAAGHRRFRLPVTVGRLSVVGARVEGHIAHLEIAET